MDVLDRAADFAMLAVQGPNACGLLRRLTDGSLPARFHVSGPTQVPVGRTPPAAYGTVTRCGSPFQGVSAKRGLAHSPPSKAVRSFNPAGTSPGGLGWSPFARRY